MNERNKTLAFVGFAALVGVVAWSTQPKPIVDKLDVDAGTKFFPKFDNPLAAKTLEILDFNEDQGALVPFKVTQINGVWSIPSHSNYPADASRQMAEAAASLIDVKKLDVASTNPADQEVYGVVDPTSSSLSAGSRGVGKKVVVQDGGGNVLAQFIVGKADTDRAGVRFVRIPKEDPIYRVEMNVDKLSTKFGDWIEKDLLKLNAFDVKQVSINDYSVDEVQGLVEQRSQINVDFDSKDNKWQFGSMKVFEDKKGLVPKMLGPGEELNGEKLNEMKTALDDLQIIDVNRKPAGLSADLRVEDKLAKDRQSLASLAQHGFYMAPINKQLVLFSNEGEALCGTNEGVEYVLRFGEIAGAESGNKDGEKKGEKDKAVDKMSADKQNGVGVSRFIMVTTRLNESLIAKPELQALPGPQPDKKADDKKPAGPDAKKDDQKEPAKGKKPAAEAKENGADDEEADEPAADKNPDDSAAAKKDGKKPEEKPKAEEKPKTEADLERERIASENKQKQDEYDSKVKEGKKKVKELNDRFADWYYVISDATYQKIHLGYKDVIKKKEAPKEEAGKTGEPDPKDPFQKFNELKKEGLRSE